VADAAAECRSAAAYVTQTPGGRGAVRELVELILKSKSRWEDVIQRYAT
jgi:3-deoxy-D-manno-octulosonate 8-phosphate phosphatase (KDO 8-P phosphatase)